MSYINPNKSRMNAQMTNNIMRFAGQTAVWRAYVSASAGNPMAGYPDRLYYREQTITGMFSPLVPANVQQQYEAGTFPAGDVSLTSKERMTSRDEVVYNGERYRVDTDSQPSVMNGYYMSVLRRGITG